MLAMFCPQVTNTGSNILLPRHHGKRGEIGLHDDISKAALPVTHLEVREHVLRDIPAKEHITLRKSVLKRIEEMFCGNALPAKDTLDVRRSNFDVLDFALVNLALVTSNVHVNKHLSKLKYD